MSSKNQGQAVFWSCARGLRGAAHADHEYDDVATDFEDISNSEDSKLRGNEVACRETITRRMPDVERCWGVNGLTEPPIEVASSPLRSIKKDLNQILLAVATSVNIPFQTLQVPYRDMFLCTPIIRKRLPAKKVGGGISRRRSG